MDHIGALDVNSIRFVNECSFSINSGIRYYGSSEVGSKALHVSKHDIGINYTLFLMVGLNNKIFAYVTEGPSDSHTYVEFIHQAVNSFDTNGLPVLLFLTELPYMVSMQRTYCILIWNKTV